MTPQLMPQLARTIDFGILFLGPPHLGTQHLIPLRPGQTLRRIGLPCRMQVVGRRSDRQLLADRLDSLDAAVFIDEPYKGLKRWSSSA